MVRLKSGKSRRKHAVSRTDSLPGRNGGRGAELSVARSSQINHSCPVGGAGESLGEAKSESHLHSEGDTGSWYVSRWRLLAGRVLACTGVGEGVDGDEYRLPPHTLG